MRRLRHPNRRARRRGAVAVEFAVLLPFLCFMFVTAVDFARVFYLAITVQNCARNGAYYASNYPNSDYVYNDIYGYTSLNDAVLRDAGNLSPAPTYTVYYSDNATGPFTQTVSPESGGFVQVTVNWTFQTITNYPGVPNNVTLQRSCIMQMAPASPNFP
jgi:Flp pilus assembly protein TadG